MAEPWNKGLTKETNTSVLKTSETMKEKHIDNFRDWRKRMRKEGKIPSSYPLLKRNGNLAELIGVTLGDGHIEEHPRCERLIISANSNNRGFIKRYTEITEKVFGKKPTVSEAKSTQCTRISIYQRFISKRLRIPTGNKSGLYFEIPNWILRKKGNSIRLLRGLFEAEASLSIHKPSCTYNFSFSNTNENLLNIVHGLLTKFEFHPEKRHNAVRIRRKKEVKKLKRLIHFREY